MYNLFNFIKDLFITLPLRFPSLQEVHWDESSLHSQQPLLNRHYLQHNMFVESEILYRLSD